MSNYRWALRDSDTYSSSSATTRIGKIFKDERVTYLNQKVNGYAYIEYQITGGTKKGWVLANNLATAAPGLVVGQRPSNMNLSGSNYTSPTNPFSSGQCTWFCFGRAREVKSTTLTFNPNSNRHGKNWYNYIVENSSVKKQGKTINPVSNSIACFENGTNGHVVYIEKVDGSNVYYTEANVGGTDGTVKMKTITQFKSLYSGALEGYIVL